MPYVRDPLSVSFDRQAALAIRLAIEQKQKHEKNRRLVPYIRVRVPNPPGELPVRETRTDQLSQHERQFLRACYHDDRIARPLDKTHPGTGARGGKVSGDWSLKRTWGPVPVLPGAARVLQLEVFRDASGARHARTLPAADRYTARRSKIRGTGLQETG